MASLEDIRALLFQQKQEIVSEITENIHTQIENLTDRLDKLSNISNTHTNEIKSIENDVATSVGRIELLEKKIEALESKHDDLLNRNLRNNLVIKNMSGDEKTWEETKQVVAKLLAELDGGNPDSAPRYLSSIERAHRQGKKEEGKRRPIFARLFNSEDVKYFVKQARIRRVDDVRFSIGVDHQYSEPLMERRNAAKIYRRQLIDDKTIVKDFIDFPAKVVGKYPGKDEKYQVLKEF